MSGKFTSESVQTMVRWAVILFFCYAFAYSYFNPPLPITPQNKMLPQQSLESKKDTDCDKKGDRHPLLSLSSMPLIVPVIKTEDSKQGEGSAAVCGQKAKMKYEYSVHKGQVVDKGIRELVIGGGRDLHGAELGLIGMKKGGERQVIMPPMFATVIERDAAINPALKFEAVTAKLSLLELSPAVPESSFPLRAINSNTVGVGGRALCGNRVSVKIGLWKTDGTQFFSMDKPVELVIGQSALPYGLEQGIIGMISGSERVVIVPPAYNKPLIANDKVVIPALPENEIVVAQIELLQVEPLEDKTSAADVYKAVVAPPVANGQANEPANKPKDKEK